jgi:hypothetical protein
MMLPSLARRAALALLVTSAASCADNVTQARRQPQTNDNGITPATNTSNSNEKPPTLVAATSWGPVGSSGLNGYRVDVTGVGFPAGADFYARSYGVHADGSRVLHSTGIGIVPADGSYLARMSESCPSLFVEYYETVTIAGRTIESNHTQAGC